MSQPTQAKRERTKRERAKRGCVLTVLVLAAVVALFPIHTIRWSGGFLNAEFRLTFTDPSGRPVPGVTLRVETKAGGVCHLYPINEFLPDSAPASDADGRMVFHHSSRAVEYGGTGTSCLVGIYYRWDTAPQYTCVFSLNGREVHRVRYNDLCDWRGEGPQVTRSWKETEWPRNDYLNHVTSGGDWDSFRLRYFDGNRDGKLDREESVAAHYSSRWFESLKMPEEQPVTFYVVERTITITVP